jgi:hypothetical protein
MTNRAPPDPPKAERNQGYIKQMKKSKSSQTIDTPGNSARKAEAVTVCDDFLSEAINAVQNDQ